MEKLKKYNSKRNFDLTPEPRGEYKKSSKKLCYLIQKHAASHLHYDFRLELDGTLKSWAVAKGPSLNPRVKRLAVMVEDHPISYGDFEGIIPKGQYGGGTVMLWDVGTWQSDDDAKAQLKKGHLHFRLEGKRLKGEWSLVKMKENNWLLIKKDDEFAVDDEDDEILKSEITSIVSGRIMEEIAGESTIPKSFSPQLATLVDKTPQGDDWIYELKFDGYRNLARIENGSVKMLTRNGLDWTNKYLDLVEELKKLPVKNTILDGEIVALNRQGRSDFMALQEMLKAEKSEELQYYLFDILFLDNKNLQNLSLVERKKILKKILEKKKLTNIFFSENLKFSKNLLVQLCKKNYEGIIAKMASKPYFQGRNKYWQKIKCHKRQEFVIGGFTIARDDENAIGALLIGYYENKKLIYTGKVGTGFSDKFARELRQKLEKIKQKESPFSKEIKNVFFVKPKLVCEVEYSEVTTEGALRHPSFKGLRLDKMPQEVNLDVMLSLSKHDVVTPSKVMFRQAQHDINITHPEKIIFPKERITKLDLAKYYDKISEYILPYIKNRLISVIRCPNGIEQNCFFQRHENINSEFIHELKIEENKPDYIYVKDKSGLLALVQFGVVEIHVWESKINKVNQPDQIVFDLDPSPEIEWRDVVEAAADVKLRLDDLNLKSFLKSTGGKGLHIVVPIKPKYDFSEVKKFAKDFASKMEEDNPEKYITNMNKEKRRGKIFIDYLRNDFSATSIAPFSVRALKGSPLALPLAWEELNYKLDTKKFSFQDAVKRGDIWKGFFEVKQDLKLA